MQRIRFQRRLPAVRAAVARLPGDAATIMVLIFSACLGIATDGMAQSKQYILDQGVPPISDIRSYTIIAGDSSLVFDRDNGIFVLASNVRKDRIGAIGQGPCEFQDVTSYAVVEDTVFVLDRSSSKIVGYSIQDNTCLQETIDPGLVSFSSVVRVGSSFFLGRNSVNAAMDSNTALLVELTESGEFKDLGLRKSDLEADLLMVPMRSQRTQRIKEKNGVIYFLLPYSHRVWSYDVRSDRIGHIALTHGSGDISGYATATDFNSIGKAIQEIEKEIELFLLDEQVAVFSLMGNKWILRSYSYSGTLLAEHDVTLQNIFFEDRGVFYALDSTEDEDRPYQVIPVVINSTE